ncbi:MAG: PadR family transcriptional regulator [Oscillospiraceae bacterium]|nr:PadR family transcriptional regulator [Oscillospiraceae bacterium]
MADKNNTPLTEAVYYILLSVTAPMHGYGIIQNVKEKTGGRLVLAAGTLYGAITNLMSKGWIQIINEDEATRKKDYLITDSGMEALKAELTRLEELVKNGREIIQE